MRIGIIGGGNMGHALIKGILAARIIGADHLYVSDISSSQCEKLNKLYGIAICEDNSQLAKSTDVIIIAVKPIYMQDVLLEIKPNLNEKIILSIVTGWLYDRVSSLLYGAGDYQLLCAIPNTPVFVQSGVTAIIEGHSLCESSYLYMEKLLNAVGYTVTIPERLVEGYIAVGGSGPAYMYMFIEALADAAVKEGFTRELAYKVASLMIRGAADMVLQSGEHPAVLKDAVCSPGGTTIEAVIELENSGMRSAVMKAVSANVKKARSMYMEVQPRTADEGNR